MDKRFCIGNPYGRFIDYHLKMVYHIAMTNEQVAKLIENRMITYDISYRQLAAELELDHMRIFRLVRKYENWSLYSIRKFAMWAKRRNDYELLHALSEHALNNQTTS